MHIVYSARKFLIGSLHRAFISSCITNQNIFIYCFGFFSQICFSNYYEYVNKIASQRKNTLKKKRKKVLFIFKEHSLIHTLSKLKHVFLHICYSFSNIKGVISWKYFSFLHCNLRFTYAYYWMIFKLRNFKLQ